jgi:tetratricopeptide (TPR) repeat protein
MSYINDALHKIQKEKESSYALYEDIVSTAVKKPEAGNRKILAAGILAVLCIAAGAAAWRYWPFDPEASGGMTFAQGPGALADVAVPLPPEAEKTQATNKDPVPEDHVKKKNSVVSGQKMNLNASPQPAANDGENVFEQAIRKQRQGKLEEAKELYKKVIRKEPRHFQALNNLGVVYLKLKTYKWAIVRFNDAIDVKHDYVDAHYNLACLYAQKNDRQQSLFYLKNAVHLNPEVRQWAAQDDDLKNLADLPEFNKIVQARDQ